MYKKTFLVPLLGVPSPVQNCSTTNLSSSSAAVECLPGWNGGLEQSFTIQVLEEVEGVDALAELLQRSDAEGGEGGLSPPGAKSREGKPVPLNGTPLVLANTATSPNPIFVVEGLKGGQSYLVSVRAVNAKGQSEATLLRIVTTSEHKQRRVSSGKNLRGFPTTKEDCPSNASGLMVFLFSANFSKPLRVTPLIATALGVFASFSLVFLLLVAIVWKRRSVLARDRSSVELTLEDKGSVCAAVDKERPSTQGTDVFPPEDDAEEAPDIIPASREGKEVVFLWSISYFILIETSALGGPLLPKALYQNAMDGFILPPKFFPLINLFLLLP